MTEEAKRKRGAAAYRSGVVAEEAAARVLEARGLVILERRYRTPHGEIDLIARDGAVLVFIEVKARRSRQEAAFSISARQWARLEAAATMYAADRPDHPDMRFDVILCGADGQFEHIENAYSFDSEF